MPVASRVQAASLAGGYTHGPGTTARLRSITHFEIQPDPSDPEWLRLRSTVLTNRQLFQMLQAIWPAIVGNDGHKFALIHCVSGPSAGVWFHLLPNKNYEPGCHEVPTF
jgi:hypothetical protein